MTVEMSVATQSTVRARRVGLWRVLPFLIALGPGVIGLCADNDAGGMLSYTVTGASHGLAWLLPVLVLLGLPTFFVQSLALRVAEATRLPYSKALTARVGRPMAQIEAMALYGLNTVTLVTEFVGMTLALSLAGVPRGVSVPLTFSLIVALTSARVYPRIEQLLLRVAIGSLAFIPALLLVHHHSGALAAAFGTHAPHAWFLLLALAGNSFAPWMIYWQQNAVWAGAPREPRLRRWDLATGQIAMIIMASAVLLLGAVTPGSSAGWSSPLAWILHDGGKVSGVLFAIGLFDAGLLAACTISLASLWTLREAIGRGAERPDDAPNQGSWRVVHLGTLALAALVVLWPHLSVGGLALWAQALGAVWLPISLVLLGLVATSPRLMGRSVIGPRARLALVGLALGYLTLACLGLFV